MTSYLAIEPGVRPSKEGLERDDDETGAGGLGLSGVGKGCGGSGEGVGLGSGFDAQGFLNRELGAAWKRCDGSGRGHVELETTLAEVVEVGAITLSSASATLESCMTEASWALDLPSGFDAEQSWRVEVGR